MARLKYKALYLEEKRKLEHVLPVLTDFKEASILYEGKYTELKDKFNTITKFMEWGMTNLRNDNERAIRNLYSEINATNKIVSKLSEKRGKK